MCKSMENKKANMVDIRVSARHTHLDKRCADILFGEGYVFTPRIDPTGKPQWPVTESVRMIAPGGVVERLAIICPFRKETQIEISRTDAVLLKLDAPLRMSGDIENTPGVTLEGPNGSVVIERGVIVAKRHLHVSKIWAKEKKCVQNQIIRVRVLNEERSLIFDDVVLRISASDNPNSEMVLHIDTDEANAAGIRKNGKGEVLL